MDLVRYHALQQVSHSINSLIIVILVDLYVAVCVMG